MLSVADGYGNLAERAEARNPKKFTSVNFHGTEFA
jgi:hypothetical protein